MATHPHSGAIGEQAAPNLLRYRSIANNRSVAIRGSLSVAPTKGRYQKWIRKSIVPASAVVLGTDSYVMVGWTAIGDHFRLKLSAAGAGAQHGTPCAGEAPRARPSEGNAQMKQDVFHCWDAALGAAKRSCRWTWAPLVVSCSARRIPSSARPREP